MFPAAFTSDRFVPKPLSRSLDLYVLTALFCALIAGITTLAAPSFARFGRWLLIVECIGMISVACGTLISQLPWLRRHRPLIAHLFISAVAIPVGYICGSSIAYSILGEPMPMFDAGPRRVIALITTALATVFIIYLDAMRDRIATEAAARSEAQRLAMESQLRLLRAQLDPHMLFNTLANLRSLVDVDPQLAQTMIDQLIVYMRSTLAASRDAATTLRNEFAQLRAYLEIMSLRMGPRLTYRLELPESLQQAAIPPMLLQPLLENAIKHGIEPQIGNGRIEVEARRENGDIEISITDSGLGLPPADSLEDPADPAKSSYGLVHVRERLRALYGERAQLRLETHPPHGVRALVRIPA
jgi:signal transduction histidine kinase